MFKGTPKHSEVTEKCQEHSRQTAVSSVFYLAALAGTFVC